MTAAALTGRELATTIRAAASARAAELTVAGRQPRLAVVTATDDEASAAYVRSIANAAGKEGIACDLLRTTTAAGVSATLAQLADDPEVHGVMLQTPLPEGALLADLARAIPAGKDVDGASPESLGRLTAGLPAFAPATAEAVLALLDYYHVELHGRHAVVVGRSVVVGKPVAHLLLDRHATVTISHSRTADLAAITRQADVLVVAAGRASLIGPEHVSPGATVIDVGTNVTDAGRGRRCRPGRRRGRRRAQPRPRRGRSGHHRAAAAPRGRGSSRGRLRAGAKKLVAAARADGVSLVSNERLRSSPGRRAPAAADGRPAPVPAGGAGGAA